MMTPSIYCFRMSSCRRYEWCATRSGGAAHSPELKVLLTSGYTATALSSEHGLPDNLNVVEKPYQREELAKKLRLVIGG